MRKVAWAAGIVLILDQISKYIVVHLMALDVRHAIDFLPPWLNFRMAWNEGVNFGLLGGVGGENTANIVRWGLVVLALGISLWVWIWMGRGRHSPLVRISAGLLIGGAIGNVVDRILYGAVADFLNMSLPFWDNPWSFNVADIAIFAGAIGLALLSGSEGKSAGSRKPR